MQCQVYVVSHDCDFYSYSRLWTSFLCVLSPEQKPESLLNLVPRMKSLLQWLLSGKCGHDGLAARDFWLCRVLVPASAQIMEACRVATQHGWVMLATRILFTGLKSLHFQLGTCQFRLLAFFILKAGPGWSWFLFVRWKVRGIRTLFEQILDSRMIHSTHGWIRHKGAGFLFLWFILDRIKGK